VRASPGCAETGDELGSAWDPLVAASPDIDRFCSRSCWALSAHSVYGGGAEPLVAHDDGAAVALAPMADRSGARLLCGLDPLWGFSSAVVGPNLRGGAVLLRDLLDRHRGRWDAALLTGVPERSPRLDALVSALPRRVELRALPSMVRRQISLGPGGVDAYLAGRGSHFRRNLRRAERRRVDEGVDVELIEGGGAEIVARCAAAEAASWKGRAGDGLTSAPFRAFYEALAARLAPSGALRAGFARDPSGRDLGYILGAVAGGIYRGLQLSFAEDAAALSIGNLLQYHQLRAVEREGLGLYDLGMDMPYKTAWANHSLTTLTVAVLAR